MISKHQCTIMKPCTLDGELAVASADEQTFSFVMDLQFPTFLTAQNLSTPATQKEAISKFGTAQVLAMIQQLEMNIRDLVRGE